MVRYYERHDMYYSYRYILVLFLIIFALPVLATPVIQFEKTTIDLGEVKSGQALEASFSFKNTGDEELEILNARPTCGSCTEVKVSSTKLAPGESAKVEVKFKVI